MTDELLWTIAEKVTRAHWQYFRREGGDVALAQEIAFEFYRLKRAATILQDNGIQLVTPPDLGRGPR